MPRRIFQVAWLALACFGCFACEPGEPQIDVSVTMSPLIQATATRAVVVLYPAAPLSSCEVLRLSERDETTPKRGSNRSAIELNSPPPHEAEFFNLVPGDYQIAVFVYDAGDAMIGFGCLAAAVTIELGERTDAPEIEVRDVPVT
jgi:hypothetical protein